MKRHITPSSLRRAGWSVSVCGALLAISPAALAQEAVDELERPRNNPSSRSVNLGAADTTPETSENRSSDRGELDRIIELYLAGRYQPCAEQLEAFLDPENPGRFLDDAVVERGRLYFASCSLLQGQHESARIALRTALEHNPLMQSPDSLTFPPPVVSLFLEVRDEVQELIAEREKEQVFELRRENERARRLAEARLRREQQLEKMAREEVVIVKNSRWLAAVPLGVGQFQNGQTALGTLFLVTEGLLGATVIGSAYAMKINNNRIEDSSVLANEFDVYNSNMETARTVMTVSGWSLVGVMALGIAEAQLNYRPERVLGVRERKLPPEVERPLGETGTTSSLGAPAEREIDLQPTVGPTTGGAFFGISGTF